MGILRGMNCLMVEVFIELLLVKAEQQNVMLALQIREIERKRNMRIRREV